MVRYCLALLLVFASLANAAEGVRPANFDVSDPDRRLDNRIKFPEIKGNVSTKLACFAIVNSEGKMSNTGCYTKDQFDGPFAEALSKASKKARMNPAIVNGKPRKIFLQFQAEFIVEGEDKQIIFYNNPGYQENVDAYGPDHIAGQRVVKSKEDWQDACPKHARFAVWARAYLGEDGVAGNPSIVHASGVLPTATCQDAIKQTILESSYTPAMADGYAVPSTFVEIFSN